MKLQGLLHECQKLMHVKQLIVRSHKATNYLLIMSFILLDQEIKMMLS